MPIPDKLCRASSTRSASSKPGGCPRIKSRVTSPEWHRQLYRRTDKGNFDWKESNLGATQSLFGPRWRQLIYALDPMSIAIQSHLKSLIATSLTWKSKRGEA